MLIDGVVCLIAPALVLLVALGIGFMWLMDQASGKHKK